MAFNKQAWERAAYDKKLASKKKKRFNADQISRRARQAGKRVRLPFGYMLLLPNSSRYEQPRKDQPRPDSP